MILGFKNILIKLITNVKKIFWCYTISCILLIILTLLIIIWLKFNSNLRDNYVSIINCPMKKLTFQELPIPVKEIYNILLNNAPQNMSTHIDGIVCLDGQLRRFGFYSKPFGPFHDRNIYYFDEYLFYVTREEENTFIENNNMEISSPYILYNGELYFLGEVVHNYELKNAKFGKFDLRKYLNTDE